MDRISKCKDGDILDWENFDGLPRIFHHEMDHMRGNVFVDKVSKLFLKSYWFT